LAHIFFSGFAFPTSLRLFPYHSTGSIILHHRSQLILLLSHRDVLLMRVLQSFPLVYSLVHGNITSNNSRLYPCVNGICLCYQEA